MSTSSFAVLVQAPTSDLATTGTHLDWIVGTFMSDPGLAASIPHAQLVAGAEAANGLDTLLAEGGATLHLADDGQFTADDVLALGAEFWDPSRLSVAAIGPSEDAVRDAAGRLAPNLVEAA